MTKYCSLHRKGNTIYVVFKTEDDVDLYLEGLDVKSLTDAELVFVALHEALHIGCQYLTAFGICRKYRITCWDGFYNTVAFDMDTEDQTDELVAHFAHFGYSVTNHDDEETDTISAANDE